jgi:hypothetical protein
METNISMESLIKSVDYLTDNVENWNIVELPQLIGQVKAYKHLMYTIRKETCELKTANANITDYNKIHNIRDRWMGRTNTRPGRLEEWNKDLELLDQIIEDEKLSKRGL